MKSRKHEDFLTQSDSTKKKSELTQKNEELYRCRMQKNIYKCRAKDASTMIAKLRRECRIMVHKDSRNGLDRLLMHLSETEKQVVKMFIAKAAIDPAHDKHRRTMRFEHSFLIQCAILRMKSHTAYVHLRANGLLPLPSLSTMRRLLSSAECKFGFNSLALEHISEASKGLQPFERWGTLMWDEISITKDMRFDTRSLKWKGIVDYAGETTIMVPNGLADHVLMFVFRPFLQGWIQPFAWFGTKGGAPGVVLLELVTKSILI
ncbi:uncharacterized protein LOC123471390 [Daphnia magna]|nr:uncharacterized protein LOC123471390 [Daphnia magna]